MNPHRRACTPGKGLIDLPTRPDKKAGTITLRIRPAQHTRQNTGAHRRLALVLLLLFPLLAGAQSPRVAIIIDDLGYHRSRGQAIVDLPAPVTCAVIPEAPWSPLLAERAQQRGKEVMLHLPMETEGTRPLDEGGLNHSMAHEDFRQVIRQAMARIPQATGVNNHMGSILTTRTRPMEWVMEELASRQLYFIDSRTTPESVAEKAAHKWGLRTDTRDIFLDNERDLLKINTQFNKLIAIARRRGQAIGIGHPYPETLAYLSKVLPLMKQAGIEVVPVSRLLPALPDDTRLARGPEEEAPHTAQAR